MKGLLKNSIYAAVIVLTAFAIGCTTDEEITKSAPIITLTPVATSSTYTVGETLVLTVNVSAEAGINTIDVSGLASDQIFIKTSGTVTTVYEENVSLVLTSAMIGAQTISIKVVDDAGAVVTADYDFTVVAGVTVYNAQLLYAPLATEESKTFFSTNLGETVTKNQVDASAAPNSVDIDFGYAASGTGVFWLASPAAYPTFTGYTLVGVWTKLNTTNFKKVTLSNEEYIGIKTAAKLEEIYTGSTVTAKSAVSDLVAGNVYSFQLDATNKSGKYGIVKILGIVDGNANGVFYDSVDYLSVEVIVQ
jgi:hypothetical protein